MATTPEGHVKNEVKRELHSRGVHPFQDIATGKAPSAVGAYYMPVAGPFSVHGVHDFVGCWRGVFFAIETKAPNNPDDETTHQGHFRKAVTQSGGIALTGVRNGAKAVSEIEAFVMERTRHQEIDLGRVPV